MAKTNTHVFICNLKDLAAQFLFFSHLYPSSPLSFKDITDLGMSCMADYGAPVFPFLAVGGYEGRFRLASPFAGGQQHKKRSTNPKRSRP